MLAEPITVAFSIKKVHQGLSRLEGIAKVSEMGLAFEYEIETLGLLRSRVKELSVPLPEIESIRLKKNWFTTRLIVRTKSLRALRGIPGSKQGHVILRVHRFDRKKAEQLVSMLMLYVSEYALKTALRLSEEV